MPLISRLKKLKKKAGDLLPDEVDEALASARRFGADVVADTSIDDALRDARSYLANPRRVAGDLGRTITETDTLGPRSSLKDLKRASDVAYHDVLDPAKEFVTIGLETEGLGEFRRELRQTERKHGYTGENPFDKIAALGRAWRDRDDTLGKRIVDATVDPANVIPVAGTLAKAKAAGQPITRALVRSALRELAAPAAAQFGGAQVGGAIGGERGARIGETLGLLGGGVGPNLVRRTPDAGVSTIVEPSDAAPRTRSAIRDSLKALRTPAPGSPSALAVQGVGTAAGAVGGFQASEGQDPRTRLLATLGGGVAGYGLGRRVAQGKPIGLAIEDMGERWRQIDELRDAAHAAEVAGDVARATDVRQQANALRDQIEQTLATEASSGGLRSLVGGLFGRRAAALPGVEAINRPPTRQQAQERIAAQVGDDAYLRANPDAQPDAQPLIGQQPLPGLDVAAERRTLRAIAGAALDVPRQLLLVGDLGQLGRVGILGQLQALSAGKPLQGAAAFGRAFRAAFDPGYFRELMSRREYQRWADVAYPADMSNPEFSGVFARVPGVGHFERAMFNRFTPAFAAGVAEAVFDGVKRSGDFAGMASDAHRQAVIGDWVRGLMIGRPLSDPEVGTVARAVGRIALAPRWTAGGIVGVQKILDPGPEGELARRFWGTVVLSGAVLSVGLTHLFTGKPVEDLINPTHPDSMLNPGSARRFYGVELGNGTVISPMAPALPLMRALMRPFAEGYQTYQEERDIGAAVAAMVGEGWDAGRDYLLGKANIPVRLFNDLVIRGEDWQGRPIITKEGPRGWLQAAGYAGSQNLPIALQPLAAPITGRLNLPFDIERDQRVPGTEPSMLDRALEFGAGFVGITARPPYRLPDDVADAFRGAIAARGETPGSEADLLGQYYGLRLDPSERAALFRAHPQVREFFEARTRLEGERYEQPEGRARVREYQTTKDRLDLDRRAALVALEQENLSGDEYRRRRNLIMDRHRGMVLGIQEAIFETSDPERISAALDAAYRQGGEQSAERRALDGLYAIRQEDDSSAARDEYFQKRDAYLASLSPAMREKLFQRQLDEVPTDSERRYLHAQRLMSAWYDIPKYRSFIPVEDTAAVDAALARARDLQTYTGAPLKRALILDKDTDPRIKMLALRVVAAGGKAYNPARRRFLRDNPMLASFFSSLSSEMAAQLVEPGAA